MPGGRHKCPRSEQRDAVGPHLDRRSAAYPQRGKSGGERGSGSAASQPPMPFEERRCLHLGRQRKTPARKRRQEREQRPCTKVANSQGSPALVSGEDRRTLGGGSRDNKRNRKMNQQRVQSADECHLPV